MLLSFLIVIVTSLSLQKVRADYSGIDDVKDDIMKKTHSNLAKLGHYMGYGWAGGCMTPYIGDGYKRVGDTMVADKSGRCEGYKSDHRLNLAYGNWGFEIKNIIYGERIVEILQPETLDSGVVVNNDSTPATKEIVIETTVVREVTHTVQNAWKKSVSLGLEINYFSLAKSIFTFGYETSKTTFNSRRVQDQRKFTNKLSKTMEPYSMKKWSILLSKTRTTVPYTALVIVKCSVDLQGFLRWGQGYHGESTNYHQDYRGSEKRPTVNYKFGNPSVPFYSDLKYQSRGNYPPWQWYEMKAKYPVLQPLIDDLTKESHYEFTLSGKFEDVMGTTITDRWDDLRKARRETLTSGSPKYQVVKELVIAKSGADDVPAKVVPPILVLDNAKMLYFDVPLNMSIFI